MLKAIDKTQHSLFKEHQQKDKLMDMLTHYNVNF